MRTREAPQSFRLAITLLCLWSFVVQAFIAQTHFHAPAAAAPSDAASLVSSAGLDSSSPSDSDPFLHGTGGEPACLLCKIATHGGGVALPTGVSFFVSADTSHLKPAEAAPVVDSLAGSHHWNSRAPPSA
jgi:hypothetical protein